MTRTTEFSARLVAFAGAVLLATLSLAASVGPAVATLPVVA